MGCFNSKKTNNKKPRTIYIDLLNEKEQINQLEEFCGNTIKTTNYTMYNKYL